MIDERLMLYAANALWQPVAVALLALVLARLTRRLEAGAAAPLYLSAIVMAAVIPALSFPGFPAGTAVFTFSAEALAGGPSKTPALPLAAIAFAVLILARAVWLCAGLARLYSLRAAKGIVVSEAATAPMTFGVFRPVVIWPAALWKGIAAPVRRAILAHERAHIARHDFAWNLAVEVLTLGIWWHPAVVWLKRRWAAEREFACDREAARRVPGYAAALFHAAKRIAGATPYPALGLFDSTVFEERMMKLTQSAKTLGGPAAQTMKLTALGLLAVSAVFLAVHPVALAQQDEPVLRVGGDVKSPRLVAKVEPEYTEEARDAKVEGTTVLEVVISSKGLVDGVEVIKGIGFGLDEKAAEAIYQWGFEPATKNGKPVRVRATVEVNFRLI